MARLMCMSEDGHQAVFIGTMLEDGESIQVCDECLVGFASAVLATMTGVDPTPFLAAISDPDTVPEGDRITTDDEAPHGAVAEPLGPSDPTRTPSAEGSPESDAGTPEGAEPGDVSPPNGEVAHVG